MDFFYRHTAPCTLESALRKNKIKSSLCELWERKKLVRDLFLYIYIYIYDIFYFSLVLFYFYNEILIRLILRGVAQLIRSWVYIPEVINSSPTNPRVTKVYMIVNFRAREISRGTRKLTQTPTLIKKIILFVFE
jgi:hypothetical protein